MPDGRCCSCSERQHMLTMRPLDAHGKWQGKTQKEYLCRKADEERGFTAQEFLQAKEDGWERQFKYRNTAGVSAWLTPTQAAREPGWGRCSKQPKAAKFGRQNPLCARWNSPEQLLDWREAWADAVSEPRTERKAAACPRHPSTAEIYRQIQSAATVDDILFSKVEQRAEQITADTHNDAVFTRKPTEPTR